MPRTATDSPQPAPPSATTEPSRSPPTSRSAPAELQNFLAMAAYQVLIRTGWIFKTESIVMPAVLDSIAGAGWVRGWLPLLNRFGHSVPPLLLARRVKVSSRKKWILLASTSLMATLFISLGLLFVGGGGGRSWLPLAFLGIYTAFFMCIGVNQLAFSTLQGKLIPTTSRGRLLLVSNTIGAASAVLCAFWLMPGWLRPEAARFDLIFVFSGSLFAMSAITVLLLRERRDQFHEPPSHVRKVIGDVWRVWRRDANFRRLTWVAALFGASVMLFPHYQNLGLRGLRLDLSNLMWWVIIQNVGTGLFSIPAGRIADRHGNRLVLLVSLLGVATAPLMAIGLQALPDGGTLFPLVFVFVGLTPVVLRTLQNFTLELCPPEDHPRYLSTLAICLSAPMFLSPLVGYMIDVTGFQTVFLATAGLVLVGWILCFGLHEPREHVNLEIWQTVE